MENNSHDLVETGFFASAGRPKTLKAIQRVMEKMTADELKSLKDKVSIIFAPAPGIVGQVFLCQRSSAATSGQAENQQQRVLVYLSPRIERLSQRRIESIVLPTNLLTPCSTPLVLLRGGSLSSRLTRKSSHGGLR